MGEDKRALAKRLLALAQANADRAGLAGELRALALEVQGVSNCGASGSGASGSGDETGGIRPYMFMVNAAKDAMALVARDYTYTAVNRAFLGTLSSPLDNPLGEHVSRTWGETEFNKTIRPALNLCFTGEDVAYEAWFQTAEGKREYFEVCYHPYRDINGTITHAVVIARRLTDLRRAIEASRKSEQEIKQANVALEKLLDAVPDPVYVKDESHSWQVVNRAFSELLGQPKEKLLGRSVLDFFPPKQAQEYIDNDQRVFDHGNSTSHEEEFWDSGGVWHVISTSKAVLDSPLRESRLLVGVVRDVTEQKRMEEILWRAKEDAESLAVAKSRFLANMSHEIRTPLNGVIGMLQLVLGDELKKRQREYAETAMTSANGLLAVINDILDLSKIEAGKMEIATCPFDPRGLVDSVVQAMSRTARDNAVNLVSDIDPEIPTTLVGGASRIRQILFNLVGNALKFTRSGEVHIGMSCLHFGGDGHCRLLLCVEDSGVGIPDHSVERIFDDFAQADDSFTREYQGAGLGLSIVRRLVQLMGGNLSMMSQEGEGTTVCFTVLVEAAPVSDQAAAAPPEGKLSFRRALVAEDNGVNRLLARRFLEKLGIDAHGAANGLEAVRELERSAEAGQGYDLVLMDIQMPVMDGLEAVRKIRASQAPGMAALPVVALTAHAMEGDRERFLQGGMDGYVAKPLTLEDLRQALLEVSVASAGK